MKIKEGIERQINEYKRPWKLFALFSGVVFLIIGSFYYVAPDWDISISIIMAFFRI